MSQTVIVQSRPTEKKTYRPMVLAALVISMFMAAIEMTIISTAMPSIVGELGGFSLYSWVFSAFSLMQAVTTPIYGKLSDLFGRKPIFITGIVIFLTGSILCGLSKSMIMLVIFRLIQGLGAGAVQPIAMTIVGDMYTIEERAKIQGYFSSVFGISSVIGPLVGGFIVQYAHWSWIFWMNVPLGILSIAGVVLFLHEGIEKQKRSIDYAGSGLFFISITSLMIVLIQGGVAWSWTSPQIIVLMLVFILGSGLFLAQERRTSEPMMPLHIWKNRFITVANTATFTSGALVIGLTSFLPTYIQGVMGSSAFVAGFTLTVMTVGWPIAALAAGHLIIKIGIRPTAVMGGIAAFIGSLFFITLDPAKGPIWAGTGSFIIGIGMGLTSSTFMISIQNSVQWQMRGVATASNMFMRLLGSSVGAALLGGVLNMRFKSFLSSADNPLGKAVSMNSIDQLLNSAGPHPMPANELHVVQHGLTIALHSVYWGVFALAIVTMIGTFFLPKKHTKQV
ncbi:MDR family MFS transporter [Paenibacillus filicis]|uniref:MDR family MFS transporter n=1 Tax=Paenibacillus gyeongsangnamensis TaxID=3388067 RepID=A0ABT4QLZ8_9BACL|nr:MDR family MFS transporter [Paenibacillus filicis]MCZ8517746.1 MDR family MFS transporter [Paenibacillus filicis]